MTPEFWAIIGVGIGVAGLLLRMDVRIGRLDDHVLALGDRMAALSERMAKLEGAMDGFTRGFSEGRRDRREPS